MPVTEFRLNYVAFWCSTF